MPIAIHNQLPCAQCGAPDHAAVYHRQRSGKHADPRRKLSAPPECWELWERAREHALDDSWAEWARHVLTIAAADELGIDPQEALAESGL